ncbi:MAG TPA: alpha/beta hydrolase [Streptosporangiaceae bacterium]
MAAGDGAHSDLAGLAGLADEGLAEWVRAVRREPGPPNRVTGAAALREASAARAGSRPPGPEVPVVTDLATDEGVRLRLYGPSDEPRPLTLYLHGGGFVVGDLESHDAICRRLAHFGDLTVLAVDYRRAPEHPGPAAVDDAVRAFGWARSRLNELGELARDEVELAGAGIGLAGDSAGGAIAVLAAVRLRDQGTPAAGLLLANPNADLTLAQPSVQTEGHGWGLEADDMRWFIEQWVPQPARRSDPSLSPLHADLTGLPPAVIVTSEHDPLRDEGSELARRLRDGGAEVQHECLPGMVHGFVNLCQVSPAADEAGRGLFRRFGQVLAQPARR